MTDLSQFSKDEAELLSSLPYKVGMWISYTDDQDGEADDDREAKALAACLRYFIKLNADKPLIAQIMKQSLEMKDKWPEWADQSFNVLNDVRAAIPVLRKKASPEEIKALKRALMEIGTAVAQAFGEFGSFDEAENKGFFGKVIDKFASLTTEDAGHPMNVSAAEDSALEKLRSTLRDKT